MSSNTKNLGLYKVDPKIDANQTFNIETMLNENWDKIDEAVSNVSVPVQSVNNKTGDITLTSDDIRFNNGESIEEFKVKTTTIMVDISSQKFDKTGGMLEGALSSQDITILPEYTLSHGDSTIIDTEGKVWNAVYNDLAEYFKRGKNEKLSPGDVLIWNGVGVEKTKGFQDNRVIGVYSDTYGFILGGENKAKNNDNLEKYVPIGISGRVLAKVTGDISNGDLLCSANIKGVACKSERYFPGTIIGKALQEHKGDAIDRIWILIMNI